MKIKYQEFMCFGFMVMVPPMMLFKSPLTYAAIAYSISVLAYRYDPLVKRLKTAIKETEFYYISCVGLGFILGGINRIFDGGLFLNAVWLLYYFIMSHRFLNRYEEHNRKFESDD